MDTKEQQKMYKEAQSALTRILQKGKNVDRELIENQLMSINRDISSNDEGLKKSALAMFEFLVNTKCKQIQTEIIRRLNDNADNKLIQSLFMQSIRKKITDNISSCQSFCEILEPWQNQDTTVLVNILEEICVNDIPRDKCKFFLINGIIPKMMSTNIDDSMRNILTDIAFKLATVVPINDLTSDELALFFKEVTKKYVTAINDLRDKENSNWHNLWIFLIRFCDKKIHNSMDLTNLLLRVVEYAFRSSSVQQRLRGYDCWKELIDNANLDKNHICSSKQIKLLITPLRAKFSKQEVVISKRFDVFAYLLEKLQSKAVLCLREFLEFCYGPLENNKDESRSGQGKSVLEVRLKSTKVLIELIGHSHGKNVPCLETGDIIKLEKRVIHANNFPSCYQIIMNSVAKCCALLKGSYTEIKRMEIVKCMWITIFSYIISPSEMSPKYFQLLEHILDDYLIRIDEDPYFDDLLGLIFTVLLSFDKDSHFMVHKCTQPILKQLITIIFRVEVPVLISDHYKTILSRSFSQIMLFEEKLNIMEVIMKCFSSIKMRDGCVSNVAKIWLCSVCELISDFAAEKIEKFEKFQEFFLWPAHNLHSLDEKMRKQIVLHWMKLYRKLSSEAEDKKLMIMKQLEIIFKNNPLLASDVLSLLNVMSQFETRFSKEFVIKLMEVLSSILLLPILQSEDEHKITALVMQYFEPNLECYKTEENEEVIKTICTCIEHILCVHQGFRLLESLVNFYKNCSKDLRSKFTEHLQSVLLEMYTKMNDTKSFHAKELYKAIGVFSKKDPEEDKKTFAIPSGRSARIASLAKSSPKSPSQNRKAAAAASPISLRLFGKDPETMTPLRARGSQLNNTTPTRNKRMSNPVQSKAKSTPSINEEDSSEFVKIDTEVKFQPSKLNEHQKEVMRKKREDIPALYQDLSQSLSQDMFSSKSNSKEGPEKNKDILSDNQKIVVENIESKFLLETENGADIKKEVTNNRAPEKDPRVVDTTKMNSESDMFSENIKELPMEDIISGSSDEHMINKQPPDDKIDVKSSKDQIPHSRDNLFSQISEGLEQKNGEEIILDEKYANLFSDASSTHFPRGDSEDIKSDISNKEREVKPVEKKKKKVEAELERLKMDIVGAEKFLETTRRTRAKEKPKKVEEVVNGGKKASPPEKYAAGGKKLKTSPTDKTIIDNKKINGSPVTNPRRSMSTDKPDAIAEKNRRKSIAVISKTVIDKYVPSSEEAEDQSPMEMKESTHDAKFLEKELPTTSLESQDNPYRKPKERKTSSVKKNTTKLQEEKVMNTFSALNKTEQDTPERNKRKPMKLKQVTGTKDIDSALDQPILNVNKTPLADKPSLRKRDENPTGEVERTLSTKKGTVKLLKTTADKKEPADIKESDPVVNGDEISGDSNDSTRLQEVDVTTNADLATTAEKDVQESGTEQKATEDARHFAKLDEEEAPEDVETACRTEVNENQNPAKGDAQLTENDKDSQDMKNVSLDMEVKQDEPQDQEIITRDNAIAPMNSSTEFHVRTNESSTIDEETPDIFFEKRGEKRKHSTDDEDIIESSQESFAEITHLNSSKKKQTKVIKEQSTRCDEDTMVQQNTVTAADFISNIKETELSFIEVVEETEANQEFIQTEHQIEDIRGERENTCLKEQPKETERSLEQSEEIPAKVEQDAFKEIELTEIPMQTVPDGEKQCQPGGFIEHNICVEQEVNTTQDTTLTQETSQESCQVQDSTQDSFQTEENTEGHVATQDTLTQPTFTQETPTQRDFCSESEESVPPVLYFDLPKKPNLTESEQMMCRMDTMSICGVKDDNLEVENRPADHQSMEEIELRAKTAVEGGILDENPSVSSGTPSTTSGPSTPVSSSSPNSLPSSPVTVDTPTRTSKLLDDTMDISPIASNNSSPETHNPVPSRLLFPDEVPELKEFEMLVNSNKDSEAVKDFWKKIGESDKMKEGGTSSDDPDEVQNDLNPVLLREDPLSDKNGDAGLEGEAVLQNEAVTISDENLVGGDENIQIQNGHVSRNSNRDSSTIQERSSKLLNMINIISPMSHNLLLRRKMSGTTSSPSGGRIRKLMSNFCQKQTTECTDEISEDDILTFSREIPSPLAVPKSSILKRKLSDTGDADGISPCAKRKRVNFSDPCLTSKKLFIKDDFQPSLEAKRLFDPIPEPKADDNIRDIFEIPDDVASEQWTETENIETEPSLDILNPMILRKDRPIYPKLVDCKEDVLVIVKRVTSPMFITALTNRLKAKNISTIGELAQQSEAEINRFPFKVPVVANVFKALDNYYKKKAGIVGGDSGAERKVNGTREAHKKEAPEVSKAVVPKMDIASELKILMQRALKENYPIEDLASVVLSSVDKQKIIALVKGHQSSITVIDFLEETHYDAVLKHISERTSVSEVLHRIENCYTEQSDEYFSSIAEYASSTVPLENLLRGPNIKDIIEAGIKQSNSSKKEVIENCLLPLVTSPNDISSYLNSISMVDFGKIVVTRLETENLGEFLSRIKESFPQTFAKAACDNCLVSPGDISTSFKRAVESCTVDKKTEIMAEMFKYITENLNVNTSIDLVTDFLKRVPTMLLSREK